MHKNVYAYCIPPIRFFKNICVLLSVTPAYTIKTYVLCYEPLFFIDMNKCPKDSINVADLNQVHGTLVHILYI